MHAVQNFYEALRQHGALNNMLPCKPGLTRSRTSRPAGEQVRNHPLLPMHKDGQRRPHWNRCGHSENYVPLGMRKGLLRGEKSMENTELQPLLPQVPE